MSQGGRGYGVRWSDASGGEAPVGVVASAEGGEMNRLVRNRGRRSADRQCEGIFTASNAPCSRLPCRDGSSHEQRKHPDAVR